MATYRGGICALQLPGQILVGEGKPNNQNHAVIFTRGEAIQAIDMNQDASLEDAIKIRQVRERVSHETRDHIRLDACWLLLRLGRGALMRRKSQGRHL